MRILVSDGCSITTVYAIGNGKSEHYSILMKFLWGQHAWEKRKWEQQRGDSGTAHAAN